jgi:galactose-1-phosphate uridylyltransferase
LIFGKEKEIKTTKFLSPLKNFAAETQEIEYRKDLFTGIECRINIQRSKRVKQASSTQENSAEVTAMINKTKENCFFCPGNLEKNTPKFTGLNEERIMVGESCAFPNLFPFGLYHGVATFSTAHFLDLPQFSSELILNNLKASILFMEKASRQEPKAKYPVWSWNHLPSAAASIVHPHTQILIDGEPTPFQFKLIENSRKYFAQTGQNYWLKLITEEKETKERFIGEVGNKDNEVVVLASYAPVGNNEVLLIFKNASTFSELNEEQLSSFAACLVKILRGYSERGVNAFNVTTYAGSMDKKDKDYYTLHARIISRPNFQTLYTNDVGFMEKFHYAWIIETKPEDVACHISKYFK